MNWALAIKKNQKALALIVAEIVALVGWVAGAQLEHLSRSLYLAATRLLRPTESALRRLIVIAARGLVVKPRVSRAFPQGLLIAGGGERPISFPLFDARKRFEFVAAENPLLVMVKTYSANPFNPFERHHLRRAPEPVSRDYGRELSGRLAAVKHALENLPQQALRMARWQAKRKTLAKPKFTSPLRPGHPPGYRDKPEKDVDLILTECHGLAWDAMREDSS